MSSNKNVKERKPCIDLSKYMDKEITIKFIGGRQVTGILKGFDGLLNIVLDGGKEIQAEKERNVGLLVCRGPTIMLISPKDGYEEIENPFMEGGEEEEEEI
jgi:U6 snRNA-associated Sm-like protein LSm7